MLCAARWLGSEESRNPARLRTPRVLRPERLRCGKSSRRAKMFADSNPGHHGLPGAVFGVPKSNSTFGGVSAPSVAAK